MCKGRYMMKRAIFRFCFMFEVLIFVYVYLFGAQGMQVLHSIEQENGALEKNIQYVRTEIAQLNQQILAWQSEPFYKEKVAREQLQMARKGDVIYYLSSSTSSERADMVG
jgi:cell division protein FtsB